MVASHDPQIIDAVPALARETGRGVDDFRVTRCCTASADAEQRQLADEGNHVRGLRTVSARKWVRILSSARLAGAAPAQPDVLPAGAGGAQATSRRWGTNGCSCVTTQRAVAAYAVPW